MWRNKKTQFAKKNRETILPSKTALIVNYIIAVLIFAIAFLFVLMLASYSPDDNSWFKASNNQFINNQLGIFGAYVSDIFLSVFGLSAWWFVFGLFYLGYTKIIRERIETGNWYNIIRIISFIILIISSSTFEYLALYDSSSHYLHNGFGGVFGKLMFPVLAIYLGQKSIICLSFILTCISFAITFIIWFLLLIDLSGLLVEKLYKVFYQLISRKNNTKAALLEPSTKDLNNDIPNNEMDDVDFDVLLDNLDNDGNYSENNIMFEENDIQNNIVEDSDEILPPDTVLNKDVGKHRAKVIANKTTHDSIAGKLPPVELLNKPKEQLEKISRETLDFVSMSIENKLAEFGVEAKVTNAETGPVITRYELIPSRGVRGDKIVGLGKEIARGLALTNVRIVETIPGKNSMGIEVPNFKRQTIYLKEIFDSPVYRNSQSKLTLALGKDIAGQVIVTDLAKMPHLLVAGTTGSGKSVAVNAMILSILFQAKHDEVKFIMIDPKMVELSFYQDIPHLLAPVVTDMTQAANALKWTVGEMERRYKVMAKFGCKNIVAFNQKVESSDLSEVYPDLLTGTESEVKINKWPYIVVIIDELADLMMVVGKKVEQYIARIAQKARAVGIHLIVATQRPSVDVITGLIKANIPARISFQVSSKIDSRTILDQMGAEALLGQGDMLFLQPGSGFPQRIHGAFVNDDELNKVVDFLKNVASPEYEDSILTGETEGVDLPGVEDEGSDSKKDAIFDEAVKFIYDSKRCSISALQTRFSIGYNRAARIMNHLEQIGMVRRNDRGGYEICKTEQ